MIPLHDNIPSRRFPLVNWLLIAANGLVFVFLELRLSPRALDQMMLAYGVVPRQLFAGRPQELLTLLTSQFLHGGWLHLISNMWALFIFGDNVEDRLGRWRYLVFYLLGGVAAALVQAFVGPASRLPMVGASGAIAGVLAAYLLLFPYARVSTFVPLFFLPWFVEVPAVIYLLFWFVSQFFSGVLALNFLSADMGGVAYWAHIGGFAFGLFTVRAFAPRPPRPPP